MNAKLAPTAAPANALKIWADARYIYAELPSKTIPCVMSFDRNAAGLSKVINLVYGHADVSGSPIISDPIRKLKGTPAQHDMAQAIMRRMGMVK